jgi:phosphohistidine phosphatase
MKLYLVQHGEATSKEENPDRPLTDKGRGDSKKTADFLKKAGMTPDVIWHSTKTRAIETANIFSEALSLKEELEQREGLAPNDPVAKILDDIFVINKEIMIISHLPFLQKLTSLILLNSESYDLVKFQMGSVIALEQNEEGKWALALMIIPEVLKNAH